MPRTSIVIYQEKNGQVPLLMWLDGLPTKVQDKCIEKVERLEEKGYDLKRPHCDLLEQGIYELRARYQNVHYRILLYVCRQEYCASFTRLYQRKKSS